MSAVGFEPTSANTVELESTPLDRSGTLTLERYTPATKQHTTLLTAPLQHSKTHHTITATCTTPSKRCYRALIPRT